MSEFEPPFEFDAEELRQKAERWLSEARSALEASADSPYLEPSDDRFLLMKERGLQSGTERALAILAIALDRRDEFLEVEGKDIILEQFRLLKLALDKSPDWFR